MKKKHWIIIICICTVLAISIFGSSDTLTELTLGEYTDIEVEVYETVVTDEDVENALIDAVTADQENVEITNRAVRNGDIANIDYSGKVDGEEFEGGTDTKIDLEIGSDKFIEGFEEQVIGMKVGQTADIKVTFPDPYYNNEELSGVEVIFTVKVNSISGKDIPSKITDAMIKELTENTYTTVKEYRTYLRSQLEEKTEETNNYNMQESVWEVVVENATITSLSSKKIKYYSGLFESNYQDYADMYGVSLAELIESYIGITQAEFIAEKKAYAEDLTKKYGIAEAIAEKEDISVSDDEYQTYLEENEVDLDNEKEESEFIKDMLLYQKVVEFIVGKSKITMISK